MPGVGLRRERLTMNLTGGFFPFYSNRLEVLRDRLVSVIQTQPLSPLENEVILVQSNGIAQWLKLSLASREHGCGIAAGLKLLLPGRFQWRAYRAVLGNLPEDSPFEKSHLLWRLMRLLPQLPPIPEFHSLRTFLIQDPSSRKLYQLAQRLADLFDQYQVYRADWLLLWANGRDLLTRADQSTQPVPSDHMWQPYLWRLLMEDLPEAHRDSSRAHVHHRFLTAVDPWLNQSTTGGLPRRILVFGISSLPRQLLEVLMALGRRMAVHVFVHNPSRAVAFASDPSPLAAYALPDASFPALHPLLAAWGRQGNEYLKMLSVQAAAHPHATESSQFVSFGDGSTLLQQLQNEILNEWTDPTSATLRAQIGLADHSLTFQVAHSPQREVEILQDQLLAAFQADPELQPRDIMVMVPDIHTYAPHIQAVFGQIAADDPRYLPFTVNDQDRSQAQTLFLALDRLLQLDQSRMTVSELIDWLEVPAFRQAAGITGGDLPRLERWIQESGIRWGFDADHRAQLGLPEHSEQNTWRFGLRRMILGYAVGESSAWSEIEPLPRVGGLEAAVAGTLDQLVRRLHQWWRVLQQPAAPAQWHERLSQLLPEFFAPQSAAEESQLSQLQGALETWLQQCQDSRFDQPLPLNIVREHWLGGLREPHLSQRFLGGAINFATLMPMRAIPFRRVCLLGMNEPDFPRQTTVNEFDLMNTAGMYRAGDRSRGDDDRYLFLEALLSARESLYISWVGRSIRDNSARPPSVLCGQLRDHVAGGWQLAGGSDSGANSGRALVEHLTTTHPLQPFSREYFQNQPRLFTYSNQWRAVHREFGYREHAVPRDQAMWQPQDALTLTDLGDFLKSPVDAFFQRVLQVRFSESEGIDLDNEPFVVAGLERWSLNQEILHSIAAQLRDNVQSDVEVLLQQQLNRIRGEGSLPHPPFAQCVQEQLQTTMRRQVELYRDELKLLRATTLPSLQLAAPALARGHQITLNDSLDLVFQVADAPQQLRRLVWLASDLRDGQKFNFVQVVRLWPQHLALCTFAGEAANTIIIHGGGRRFVLAGMPAAEAGQMLLNLLQAFDLGMQQPLPVACQTAYVGMVDHYAGSPSQSVKAEFQYNGGDHLDGDATRSPLLARCWPTFEALVQPPARTTVQPSFDQCVERLYRPFYTFLCDHCEALEQEGHDD
ncbi:MAG: exodeoxyribonuclease V subunit gamma [Pirellulaceae bacterium]|nr:exodeoxyribonuclease V subunit gamma [Pirellulaceae bacterium]